MNEGMGGMMNIDSDDEDVEAKEDELEQTVDD
jgi:hypothetical protein